MCVPPVRPVASSSARPDVDRTAEVVVKHRVDRVGVEPRKFVAVVFR